MLLQGGLVMQKWSSGIASSVATNYWLEDQVRCAPLRYLYILNNDGRILSQETHIW